MSYTLLHLLLLSSSGGRFQALLEGGEGGQSEEGGSGEKGGAERKVAVPYKLQTALSSFPCC